MRVFTFTPSENLAHVELGEEFQLNSDGRYYLLLARDSVRCYIARETWWDKVVLFFRGENQYVRYSKDWPALANGRNRKKKDSVV